ncbi:DUF484 family protein [Halioglobus pacificus]|uniref:DUF484 domain-containing protein n=1 Tax=Parahalioglobus pacificus TaxID=930806 RepID=A0A918XKU2_9GAMM|nr:DUF484 family protein [Halioglobus pacificus]GHD36467.1 hypothetical protein GCM10007053_24910 [Halioglobus pacificus]
MSGTNEQAVAAEHELDEDQVREYLKEHADFFQRHPDMLDHLHISHASGSAVSLVEKQVSVLRERNVEMRHRLNALTANARDNDLLYENTRHLVLTLLEARDRENLAKAFTVSMEQDFKVEHASLILFGEPGSEGDCRLETADSARIEIGAILKGRKPMCGVLRKEELGYLFPNAGDIGSAAVVPLVAGEELGVVAVGSSDAQRYHSGMGTLFLTHIADVLVRCMAHLPRDGHA